MADSSDITRSSAGELAALVRMITLPSRDTLGVEPGAPLGLFTVVAPDTFKPGLMFERDGTPGFAPPHPTPREGPFVPGLTFGDGPGPATATRTSKENRANRTSLAFIACPPH